MISSAFDSHQDDGENTAGDLLPCPFCGGTAIAGRSVEMSLEEVCHYVACDNDDGGCIGATVTAIYLTEREAATAWNTRTPAVSPDKDQG